ncbi:phosphoadenosine phosphosulfate reductase [Silvibacterium bohemicum]|uniref:Adenosine 5'-phosphosulfate reductase n=1 Tax=Silvibacterium bohemicum TaxID=1577686 RepID=A0A841JWA2_9BACT|nr:phosphoadenylyl-sulfate reductase [Silvibacterium bohemicum]MBB6145626.1 phosphoadenosine phosphosulfate reductase [Silvibacterium bohemicum]
MSTVSAPLSTLDEKIAEAAALIRSKLQAHSGDACVTSSFQAEDVVVLHLVRQIAPEIPVLFLDTGYHFRETYEYRDRIAAEWRLNLKNILPVKTVAEQEAEFGILNRTAPDRCCALRKVGPLFAALEPYALWFTGLRRQQAKTRANLQAAESFTLPTGKDLLKLSPLADWHTRDVWQYAERHAIPLLSLYDRGYSSIGCEPCTSLPLSSDDPRSGRWGGNKVECGIHIQPAAGSHAEGH